MAVTLRIPLSFVLGVLDRLDQIIDAAMFFNQHDILAVQACGVKQQFKGKGCLLIRLLIRFRNSLGPATK